MADSSDLSLSLDHARILTLLNSTRIPIKKKSTKVLHTLSFLADIWSKKVSAVENKEIRRRHYLEF